MNFQINIDTDFGIPATFAVISETRILHERNEAECVVKCYASEEASQLGRAELRTHTVRFPIVDPVPSESVILQSAEAQFLVDTAPQEV